MEAMSVLFQETELSENRAIREERKEDEVIV